MRKNNEELKVKSEGYKIRYGNYEGITLVALVITIIVLIILAGVSINAVMNDGLIDNSKEAKETYEKAKNEEEETIAGLQLDGLQIELLKINSPLICKYGCVTGVSVVADETTSNGITESVDSFRTKLPDGYDIYSGENIATGNVATGMTVKKSGSNESYTVVVYGDVDMNGEINDDDSGTMRTFIDKTAQPTLQVQLLASDVDGNGYVIIEDYNILKRIIYFGSLDFSTINQNTEAKDPSKIKASTNKELAKEFIIDKLPNDLKKDEQWKKDDELGEYLYVITIEANSVDVATLEKYLDNDSLIVYDCSTWDELEGTDKISEAYINMTVYNVEIWLKLEV